MRSFARGVAAFFVLAGLAISGLGCGGKEDSVPPGTDRTLKIEITFPTSPLLRGPRPILQRATVGADTMRIWVLDDLAPTPTVIESLTVAVVKGTTNQTIEVGVRDAERYRVRIIATGERQRPGAADPTSRGIQFFGETTSTPTLQIETVPIDLLDAVPRPAALATASGDSLSWSPVFGAATYAVSDSVALLDAEVEATLFAPGGFGSSYRVAANLAFGPTTAWSEPVTPGRTAPAIALLTPLSIPAQDADFDLIVEGSDFANLSIIVWDSVELTTTFESTTRLRARVSNLLFPAVGTAAIRVRNPDGLVSAPRTFTITARRPVISTFTPPGAIAGDPTFTLTIDGAAFTNGAQVVWNGVALPTTFVSAARLTAIVDAARFPAVGNVTVEVVNAGGERSNPATYPVVAEPIPTLATIDPDTVRVGSPGFTLTVDGADFRPGAWVTLNGAILATTFVNSTRLTAAVPADSIATVHALAVRVRNPVVAISGTAQLYVVVQPPALATVSPTSAMAGRGSIDNMIVTGSRFAPGAQIQFDTQPLTTTFISPTSLQATVLSQLTAVPQTYEVTVRNPDGQISNGLVFDVYPDPYTAQASLPQTRWGFGSANVSGLIFVAGGWFGTGGTSIRTNVVAYNTALNTWAERSPTIPASLLGVGTALVSGKMYFVANNRWPDTTWVYTPTSNTWSQAPGIPQTSWDCAVAAVGANVYAIGGDGPADPWPAQNTVHVLNTSTNVWSTRAPMPTARSGAAIAVIAGKIYVAGGTDHTQDLATLEVYDPVANTWSARCPMPEARSFSRADVMDGKMYVFGGAGSTPYAAVYDPVTDRWSSLSTSRLLRRNHAVHAQGTALYLIGGRGSVNVQNNNETYTPGIEQGAQLFPCGSASARLRFTEGALLLERRFTQGGKQHRSITEVPQGR